MEGYMSLLINSMAGNLRSNVNALAQLNTAMKDVDVGERRVSRGSEGSIRNEYTEENMMRDFKANSVAPAEIARDNGEDAPRTVKPQIDTSVLANLKQQPFDMSALDRVGSIRLLYGVECNIRMMKNGVNDLAAAQQTGTSIYNNALSNQASVMSGVGRGTSPATIQSGVGRGTSLASTQGVQSGVGRGTSPATIQSGVGRGASLQTLGGERGNSALLAQNYNQLMNVDLNNAAATSTQNATAPQSVLRLF
jgi:hypothetical protein